MTSITSMKKASTAMALAASTTLAGAVWAQDAPEVEVMHMWSAGAASAEALALMAERFREVGGEWADSPISGGTSAQLAALRARVIAGNAPTVAQLKGPMIHEWAELGQLASVQEIAEAGNWDEIIPDTLRPIMQHEGEYVAVPLNIHRINWIYYNPTRLAELGMEYPTNWDEFNAVMDAAAEAGMIPVAHGLRPWQDLTMFETVALGYGGVEWFRDAFVELDRNALESDTTRAVFAQVRRMVDTMDEGAPGRHWTDTAEMVGNGEAMFYFMGDWVLGHFERAGFTLGEDYACEGAPQNDGVEAFTLNTDSFAFFNQSSDARQEGQAIMAAMAIDDAFQRDFNLTKGSIPANVNTSLEGFSPCQLDAADDLAAAMDQGGLVPSFAHGMAQSETYVSPVTSVIAEFFASDMSPEEAQQRLLDAIDQAS